MELSATELRIGNLVGIASSLNFSIGKVTLISNNRILLENKISNKSHKFIPIQLTEEWLLKFGLLKTREGSFLLGSYELINYENSYRVLLPKNGILSTIKYVHQLQNLYFSFTGEELII